MISRQYITERHTGKKVAGAVAGFFGGGIAADAAANAAGLKGNKFSAAKLTGYIGGAAAGWKGGKKLGKMSDCRKKKKKECGKLSGDAKAKCLKSVKC